MKVLSIVLSVIAALLIALIAVFLIGGSLGAEVSMEALPGTQDLLGFAAALESVELETASAVYAPLDSLEASDYTVSDLTVTFKNNGFLDAEWLTFDFVPGAGEVALCTQSAAKLDVAAHGEAKLALKLLSRAEASGAGRALNVEYYVLGMRRTMTVPLELS